MHTETFAIIALFVLAFGLISGRLEKSLLTPPMAFVGFGLLVGPVLGLIQLSPSQELVRLLAEFTLILVLFTDASRIDFSLLRRDYLLPLRMLSIGLPLTIAIGTVLALWLLGDQLRFWEAAALATILAPTDAALGQAVISSPRVPLCIRQAINVESGLNDGICLPFLLIFLSLAGSAGGSETTAYWIRFVTQQVVLGPIVGFAVSYLSGQLILQATRRQWMTHSFEDLAVLGLSLLAYSLAEIVGGNGFIAAFCAGLTLGNTARPLCQCLQEFGEAEGQLLVLLMLMLYGAVMVVPSLDAIAWPMALYGILSLVLVRMVGIWLSVLGLGLRRDTVLFLGWFGPRGVASVLYGLLVLEGGDLPHTALIFDIMVFTVLVSVFAHGISAFPAANWYGQRMAQADPETPEMKRLETMVPTRLNWRDSAH